MPELPEVETIVCELCPLTVGRRITGVDVLWPGSVGGASPEELAARLVGQRIEGLTRRAKFIVFRLSSGDHLLVHLRMTGRLLLRPPEAPPDRFTKVTLTLDGGEELRFTDIRKFGRVQLLDEGQAAAVLAALGPEPLEDGFRAEDLRRALGARRAPLKSLLLNQTLLAGLGNIYADEALYLAGLHPLRQAVGLSAQEWGRLYEGIRQALRDGIADRGTTFSDFRDSQGREGGHQEHLAVYRRTGEPCRRCATPIERIVVTGRSTHFCPSCQT
ncbi:MAG: bifunctional DNA-formamidopyrimidine glycosylase/DNA-(apurinic or apyrimidinic site) lyase [Chloroflexota bacterium]